MAEVTHVSVSIFLGFEDGYSITIGTPTYVKDIRDGLIFSKEQLAKIVDEETHSMVHMLEETEPSDLHKKAKAQMAKIEMEERKDSSKLWHSKPSTNGIHKKPKEEPPKPN